jgi:hypothetical protein
MAARKRRRRKRKGHYHTGTYTSTKTGQACKYRSGWELAYLAYLDGHAAVKDFGYESVKIPYISNVRTGKVRNYFPDFLVLFVDGSQQLVEIKPKRRVSQVKVQKKLKAAEVWCREHGVTLVVLTEVELKVMGLLK